MNWKLERFKGKQVRCNKCGTVADALTFGIGYDFFQEPYIGSCANKDCDNRQSPGDASMRMFGGARPFEFISAAPPAQNVAEQVLRHANGAS